MKTTKNERIKFTTDAIIKVATYQLVGFGFKAIYDNDSTQFLLSAFIFAMCYIFCLILLSDLEDK